MSNIKSNPRLEAAEGSIGGGAIKIDTRHTAFLFLWEGDIVGFRSPSLARDGGDGMLYLTLDTGIRQEESEPRCSTLPPWISRSVVVPNFLASARSHEMAARKEPREPQKMVA